MALLILLLKILAIVLWVVAGVGLAVPRVNLVALGLASWGLAELIAAGA
jgi:hypothetical protein